MDAAAHEAIAVATFEGMPEKFQHGSLGRALSRLQPEEWQLYTVIADRVDGDNILFGYFHSHKFEFDEQNQKAVTFDVSGQMRPKYSKGSAHPVILSYYVMMRNRHHEEDFLEVRHLGARISHYIIDGMTTIWHLWSGKLSDKAHAKCEKEIGNNICALLKKTKPVTVEPFSQGNIFKEIARRTEKFYWKWLPFALETAKSGENIAKNPKTVEMIQDVKDNLGTMWSFIDAHMSKDSKKAKLAKNYGIEPSKPIPESVLKKMTKKDKKLLE